jgi:2,6-dihydroxypyridine 3-monooxygenase
VIGGSLGGLNAALWLADAGCDVQVWERSHSPLEGRGAGIVLHPATLRYFTEHRLLDLDRISAPARGVRYLSQDGSVAHETPCRYRFTAWNTLYRGLLESLGPDRYQMGTEADGFDQDETEVRVHRADGATVSCELAVAADGVASTARRILAPEAEPRYAGYVGWRGTVEEEELSPETFGALSEVITYHVMAASHILAYPIPSGDEARAPGGRRINWVWYRNVAEGPDLDSLMTDRHGVRQAVGLPPGGVRAHHVTGIRHASVHLPPRLAEMVEQTSQPFIQAVVDVEVPRMAFGRICLLGDAAFALRPHAAVGTAKAAEDAWRLARAVEAAGGDVVEALAHWEPGQLALGRQVLARSRDAGIRSQFEGTWKVGDPLPFGLYRESDSAIAQDSEP